MHKHEHVSEILIRLKDGQFVAAHIIRETVIEDDGVVVARTPGPAKHATIEDVEGILTCADTVAQIAEMNTDNVALLAHCRECESNEESALAREKGALAELETSKQAYASLENEMTKLTDDLEAAENKANRVKAP